MKNQENRKQMFGGDDAIKPQEKSPPLIFEGT